MLNWQAAQEHFTNTFLRIKCFFFFLSVNGLSVLMLRPPMLTRHAHEWKQCVLQQDVYQTHVKPPQCSLGRAEALAKTTKPRTFLKTGNTACACLLTLKASVWFNYGMLIQSIPDTFLTLPVTFLRVFLSFFVHVRTFPFERETREVLRVHPLVRGKARVVLTAGVTARPGRVTGGSADSVV